jgi:hypothetical protein
VVLVKEHDALGVEPEREEDGERVAPRRAQRRRGRRERERMPADDAEEQFVLGTGRVLQLAPAAERAEVVAELPRRASAGNTGEAAGAGRRTCGIPVGWIPEKMTRGRGEEVVEVVEDARISVCARDASRRAGESMTALGEGERTRVCDGRVASPRDRVSACSRTSTITNITTCNKQRCAPEVWIEIIRHIGGFRAARARSLKATSLVFKALTPYAQAELFRFVSIVDISDAEHLLEAFKSNYALQRCIREVMLRLASYRDEVPLYKWLLLEPAGVGVLASFTQVTFLELVMESRAHMVPDVDTITRIFSHFKSVIHLRFEFDWTDFKQVATVFSCLRSTLRHLDISIAVIPQDEDSEPSHIDDVPSVLSAETLSHYTPQDALPHLESLWFRSGIGSELTEWVFRSTIINRIRTLKVIPELLQDVKYAALLLSRGCKRPECLVLDMISGGWEGFDASIGVFSSDPSFQISKAHASSQPRLHSLRASKRFAS